MREIDFTPGAQLKVDRSPPFVPLGTVDGSTASGPVLDRISRKSAAPQREIWGTLGPWESSAPLSLRGTLRFSAHGDQFSRPEQSGDATCRLIEQLRRGRDPVLPTADLDRVLERFIDLSDLWVESPTPLSSAFTYEQHPALRLTLFVRPGEGALVVLQRGRFGEYGVEFIQPEPTGNAHTCTARDRLDYRIPLPFDQPIRAAGTEGFSLAATPTRVPAGTSLKLLTFERGNSTSKEVIARALSALGRDKYRLLKWSTNDGQFAEVTPEKVRRDVKTLLLLHGTFSSTSGSFGKLAEGDAWSWLENIAVASRRYGQVLAFDHDTVLDGLQANADQLRQRLGGNFSVPIDLLTHSRGGLLGKHLAIQDPTLQVERAAMAACANGVGYFTAAQGLSRFLSVLYQFTRSSLVSSVIVALAQHSIQAVLELPGLNIMIPGNPELLALERAPIPLNRQQTTFLPVIGDYTERVVSGSNFFKRWVDDGIDLIIKAFLGKQHDWVVGTSEQQIFDPALVLTGYLPKPFPAWHTTYFDSEAVRARIESFLLRGV